MNQKLLMDKDGSSINDPPVEEKRQRKPSSYKKKNRLVALDVLRGMTVFMMVVVNAQPGGQVFQHLDHAKFNGLTATDFIFPFFLWIMGFACGIVFSREVRQPETILTKVLFGYTFHVKKKHFEVCMKWVRVCRRSILLWLLGFGLSVISHKFDFRVVRFAGVLQRIAFCYFVMAVLLSWIPSTLGQCLVVLNFHLLYLFLMFCIPYPNCGAGQISETCSAESYFDRLIFGKDHLWVENAPYYDPEGAVSSLTAISTAFLGVLFYKILAHVKDTKGVESKNGKYYLIALWMIFSVFLLFLGMLLNAFLFPYNKHIWSSAFVFVTAGSAGVLLSIITFLVDIHRVKFWIYLFLFTGVNPLFMYVAPEYTQEIMGVIPINDQYSLGEWIFVNTLKRWIPDIRWANLLFGLIFESCFLPAACVFFYQGIFIKL